MALALSGLAVSISAAAADDQALRLTPASVSYSDGSVAQALPECGAMDLCATVKLPYGDSMRVYNMGSQRCQPFTLHLVTLHEGAIVLVRDVRTATQAGPRRDCPRFANTYVTLDSGRIRMGVFLASSGNLFVQFVPEPAS